MHRATSTVTFDLDEEEEVETPIAPHIGHKKVLVTGGAGFIGSAVAEKLLARGDDVVIVDEMNDYYDIRIKESNLRLLREAYPDKKRLSIYKGDICDDEFMTNVFEQERPQWVCHMAARAGVRPSIQDPFIYIHSNIRGTTLLMELSHKFDVENFVFASSSSVYGGSTSCYFSEDENVDNPVSPYAASKKACELLAYTYHHLYQLNVSGLRFFTVYGPRGRPDMAPFKFIDRVSRGVEIQQFGDGSSSRDYTYIEDIVDGVIRAIDRRHKYEVFNLGKGSGTSLKEFIDLVQEYTGKKATIKIMPDQPGDVRKYNILTLVRLVTTCRGRALIISFSIFLQHTHALMSPRHTDSLVTKLLYRLKRAFVARSNGITRLTARRRLMYAQKCRQMVWVGPLPWLI